MPLCRRHSVSVKTTTLELVEKAAGRDKFLVLSVAIDRVSNALANLTQGVSLDDQIATLDVEELAATYGVSLDTMREKIRRSLGDNAVFRLGKKWVIRKQTFLGFLLANEEGGVGQG